VRFDQYKVGFRAPLAADYTGAVAALGVGLNASGQVVPGAGATGVIGVICLPKNRKAGDVIDVMEFGEILEAGLASGTVYTANTTTGVISNAAASATQTPIGFTSEASRLIVARAAQPFIGT
jgi:hypothetical protein